MKNIINTSPVPKRRKKMQDGGSVSKSSPKETAQKGSKIIDRVSDGLVTFEDGSVESADSIKNPKGIALEGALYRDGEVFPATEQREKNKKLLDKIKSKKREGMKEGGEVSTDPSVDRYVDEFYNLQKTKGFQGIDDKTYEKYWRNDPVFKENIPAIAERFQSKYPDASYTFSSKTEGGIRRTGFDQRPVEQKTPKDIKYRNKHYSQPVEPGILGRLAGKHNTVYPTGEYSGAEDGRIITKQPVTTPVSRRADRKIRKGMEDGGVAENTKKANVVSAGLGIAEDVVGNVFDDASAKNSLNYNPRTDPSAMMKKDAGIQTGKSLASGTLKGAAAGAALGPVGMAVGAGLGLLVSGVGAIAGRGKRKKERELASQEYAGRDASNYAGALGASSYKEGGEIKGKGGPKDDEVKMDVPEGSFIVPAENAHKAMEIGKEFLGWDDEETAGKKTGSAKINASNGEVIFSPEEVEELDYYGIDLNKLAPNARPEDKMNYKEGSEVSSKRATSEDEEEKKFPIVTSLNPLKVHGLAPMSGQRDWNDAYSAYSKSKGRKDPGQLLKEYAPETLGALQASAGLFGLATSKKLPDPIVANELNTLLHETRKLSEQGLDPATRNYAAKSIERSRRAGINEVVGRGGSAAEITSGMVGMTSQAIEGHERLAISDEEIRRRNKEPYYDALTRIAGRRDDIDREKRGIQERKDEMHAGLLHAGISNIVGARQFKEHLDFLKANKSTINFSL